MKDFTRKGFRPSGGERPRFGGGNRGRDDRGDRGGYRGGRGGSDERPRQMFQAVCAQCGKTCELPFRPNGEKPVYCQDCFKKQLYVPGRNSNGADGPRPFHPQPFAPQPPRAAGNGGNEGVEAIKRQLDNLESKVSRLLDLATKMWEKGNVPAPMPAATIEKIEKVMHEVKAAKADAKAKAKAKDKAKPKTAAKSALTKKKK